MESATPIEEVSVWIMDMQLSVEFVVVLFAVRCKGRPTVEHGLGEERSTAVCVLPCSVALTLYSTISSQK